VDVRPDEEDKMIPAESSGRDKPELRYLAIGRVVRAHGVRGEVSVTVLTDFPERFESAQWVYLGNEYEASPYRLEGCRWHKKNVLLTLAGISDRDQAGQLRGQFVQIPIEDAIPLPDGSYYLYQLLGLAVITQDGTDLGIVSDILETGANDVYVVRNEDTDTELLVPAIPDIVKAINIDEGRIVVELISGLI